MARASTRWTLRSGEGLGLELFELGLADRARVQELLRRGDLVSRCGSLRACDRLDVLRLLLPELLLVLHGALGHAAATGDQVDQHAEAGKDDDEQDPQRLRAPTQVTAAEQIAEDPEQAHDVREEDEELEHRE